MVILLLLVAFLFLKYTSNFLLYLLKLFLGDVAYLLPTLDVLGVMCLEFDHCFISSLLKWFILVEALLRLFVECLEV